MLWQSIVSRAIPIANRDLQARITYEWNDGELIGEQAVMLTGIQMQRPDVAYFSDTQIQHENEEHVPAFCIEVISPTDESGMVESRRIEYFKTGVQIFWHIFPENREVFVDTFGKTVQICANVDICYAQPVLDDFIISVDELLG